MDLWYLGLKKNKAQIMKTFEEGLENGYINGSNE